ncbi:MAG TPA: cellulase family glycosylhydrolase [Myxococcales bacterium]|nr:cellulase family glycosylhydrolase [Myxococcales bacterium]
MDEREHGAPALAAPSLATGRLRVDGPRLRDELGRQVILRGVNCGGRSKWAPYAPFDFGGDDDFPRACARYVDRVASWGVNLVRLPFSWEGLEPERGRTDEAYLARYFALAGGLWSRGIRVLLDFHQDVYATPFGGDGFPLWTLGPAPHGPPRRDFADGEWFVQYADPESPVARAFDRLWSNADGLLDDFEAMWRRLAHAAAGRPGIAGFEIINEPGWGSMPLSDFEEQVLPRVLERLGAMIRREAPDGVIFGGGPGADGVMGSTFLRLPSLGGFVYAPHYYDPEVATGGTYRDPDKVRADLERLARVGSDWGCPVLFGEFGAANRSPDQRRWIRDVYGTLDRLQAHATLWEASFAAEGWNHEDLGITEADGVERPAVEELVRPYPRAIAGTLDRFAWDPDARRFEVDVSQAGRGISEVYAPPRHLGARPRIEITGGRAAWDAAAGVVLVRAGTDRWSLVVRAGA